MSGQDLSFVTVQQAINGGLDKTVGAANRLPSELQNAALIREVEDINSEFHERGRVIMKKPFWWMEKYKPFPTYDRTTIAALTAGSTATAAIASATGWPSSGRFYIQKTDTGAVDFIDFSARSGTTLTLDASTIELDHDADSNVDLMYPVPTDFGEFISMVLDRVPYYPKDPVPENLPDRPYFWFEGEYFLFPLDIGAHDATVRYWKKPATLDTGDEDADLARSTDIPKKYQKFLFYRLAAEISLVRKRYDLQDKFNAAAEKKLLEACQFEVNATATPYSTIGPTW